MVRKLKKEEDSNYYQNTRRVLFIASVYTHLAAFHIPFMKMLQDRGYDVYAAASSADGRKEEVQAAGITCWEIPFARSPYSLANIQAFRRLKALFKEYHFDLIHVHTPVAAFLGRYLAKTTGQGPVLYTAHGFHFYQCAPLRNWVIYYTAERLAVRWTDGLVVINNEDYNNAQKLGFRPYKNLFFSHGVGVDLKQFFEGSTDNYIKKEYGFRDEDVIVVCVAELNNNKNHIFLLRAWGQVAKKAKNTHLLLVGDGQLRQYLQDYVRQEGIPRVLFLGYRLDVPQILRGSDILTLVSRREGLPKCIMEAMAARKPVIATNVRGCRELVIHEETGFLVELDDVQGLTSYFEVLINDPELRRSMGDKAREKIQAYSLENVLEEMFNIYNRYLPKG